MGRGFSRDIYDRREAPHRCAVSLAASFITPEHRLSHSIPAPIAPLFRRSPADSCARGALERTYFFGHSARRRVHRRSFFDFGHQRRTDDRRVGDSSKHGHMLRRRNPEANRKR